MNRTFSLLLLAVALLGGPLHTRAQVTFGPRVGVNLANVAVELKEGEEPKTRMLPGGQFGLMLNARFGKLAIQPAILYSQKGYRTDDDRTVRFTDTTFGKGAEIVRTTEISGNVKSRLRLEYVEIPVNLVYTTGGDQGFQVLAGPYVGFGIGGKFKVDAYDQTVAVTTSVDGGPAVTQTSTTKIKEQSMDAEFKGDVKKGDPGDKIFINTPDFGVNLGLGYLVNNFQVQALYGLGLSNLIPKTEGKKPDNKLQNRVIQVTLGYLFGGE